MFAPTTPIGQYFAAHPDQAGLIPELEKYGRLLTLQMQMNTAASSGGSFTRAISRTAFNPKFQALGGVAELSRLQAKFQAMPALWQAWNASAIKTGGLGQGMTELMLLAAAFTAGTFLAAPGASVGSAGTLADTYAAMNSAAGITTSGSVATDVALASAVQTGSLTTAAAQTYASAVAAGTVSESALLAGLADTYGIGEAVSAASTLADLAQSVPTPKPAPAPNASPVAPPTPTGGESSLLANANADSLLTTAGETALGIGGAVATTSLTAGMGPKKPTASGNYTPPVSGGQTTAIGVLLAGAALVGYALFS